MIFGIDIDIANLIVQAFIGLVTLVALIVAFWQGSQSKRNREDDIKRYQPSRISAWYEGGRNRTGQPEAIDSSGSSSCFETKASPPSTTQSSPASGLAEPAPLSKERTTAPFFPTASASARFLLEHGTYGSRRKGTEWEYARRPKRLSPTQTEHRGFGEATEGSRRFLWSRPRSTGCPSPCPGADAKS